MIDILKKLQVCLAIMVIVLCLVTFPGIGAMFISLFGFCYLTITIAAAKDNRFFIWLSLLFTFCVTFFTFYGVIKLTKNGFNFFSGKLRNFEIFDLSPYLFLIVFLVSTILLIMYLFSWKWIIYGNKYKKV